MHPFHSFTDLPANVPLFPLTGVVLMPRGALPLNVFEPRYLKMVDDVLKGDRLIGIIQPTENPDTVLRPALSAVGTVGRMVSFRETEDNRYLITLAGLCRFRLQGEVGRETASDAPYRIGICDFALFAGDMAEPGAADFPRQRLLSALKDYLNTRDLKADWKSVTTAPPDALVNALSMMCPFEPAEKQALLEAPGFSERVDTLVAILEMAGAGSGPQTLN
ncbi:MAG: LON peptidase substrate-binding domain-containing protein [Alphaproteobacteria bacterium]|nr:LON peptidase substrate-binding domain-containing protein [Alphaproteobacteria bacterium]